MVRFRIWNLKVGSWKLEVEYLKTSHRDERATRKRRKKNETRKNLLKLEGEGEEVRKKKDSEPEMGMRMGIGESVFYFKNSSSSLKFFWCCLGLKHKQELKWSVTVCI